jgi:hypothetical protein
MDVPELLDELGVRSNVVVVVTLLPQVCTLIQYGNDRLVVRPTQAKEA